MSARIWKHRRQWKRSYVRKRRSWAWGVAADIIRTWTLTGPMCGSQPPSALKMGVDVPWPKPTIITGKLI